MSSLRFVFILLLLTAICGQALAQFGGMRRGGEGRSRQESAAPRPEATRLSANDQVRLHLTDVRLALKLAPDQNTSWQAYEGKVLALLADLGRGISTPLGDKAPGQIERKVEVVRNRLTAMEEISETANKLYAILSDEQKAVADRMLAGTVPALYAGAIAGRAEEFPRDRGR